MDIMMDYVQVGLQNTFQIKFLIKLNL